MCARIKTSPPTSIIKQIFSIIQQQICCIKFTTYLSKSFLHFLLFFNLKKVVLFLSLIFTLYALSI